MGRRSSGPQPSRRGTIDSSLYLGRCIGHSRRCGVDMIGCFLQADFQRDLHSGDKFEVYYDYYTRPTSPAKYGGITMAMMTLDGSKSHVPLSADAADPEYFDGKGESARVLMKKPVDGARFHRALVGFHPSWLPRMHKGVDLRATEPVMAAGADHPVMAGQRLWNFVKISHGMDIHRLCHLRFRAGHAPGRRVRQDSLCL